MLQRFDYVFIKKVVHMCITFFTICEDLLTGPFFPLNTLCRFSFPTAKKNLHVKISSVHHLQFNRR